MGGSVGWSVMTIREATPEDIHDIVALQQALEAEGAIHGYRADPAEQWARRDLRWVLLAVSEGSIRGFVYCAPRPPEGECVFPDGSKVLEIAELVIAPSSRRGGWGRSLMAAVEQHAAKQGFTHLRVYSAAKRFDDILRFYRGCGFAPWYLEMTKPVTAAGPIAAKPASGVAPRP